MHFASIFAAFLGVIALLTSGCDVSTRLRYKTGTKLYERGSHRLYGQVVSYDGSHDFHNGMNAQAAVEIELESGDPSRTGHERVWASCDVIGSAYVTE
jgi:hypothetical protein